MISKKNQDQVGFVYSWIFLIMNCNSGSSASLAGPSDDSPNLVPLRFSTTTLQVPQIILLAMKPFHVFFQILFAVFPQTWFCFETFAHVSCSHLFQYENLSCVSSGLKRTVFSSVASLTSVQLEGNPLHCDCRLEWLAVWLSSKVSFSWTSAIQPRGGKKPVMRVTYFLLKVSSKSASATISRASCASPALLNGRLLSSVPASTLVCTGNPRDPIQARWTGLT